MARSVKLTPYLSRDEMVQRYRQAPDVVEARRWHLLRLVAEDVRVNAAAAQVGLHYEYAKKVVRRYNREGPPSVCNRSREKQAPTPRRLLSPAQQEELREALTGPAPDGGLWSGPKVAQWMAARLGRAVRPQ